VIDECPMIEHDGLQNVGQSCQLRISLSVALGSVVGVVGQVGAVGMQCAGADWRGIMDIVKRHATREEDNRKE